MPMTSAITVLITATTTVFSRYLWNSVVCHRSTNAVNVGAQVNTGGSRNATSVGLVTDIAVQITGLSIAQQIRSTMPPTRTARPRGRRRTGSGPGSAIGPEGVAGGAVCTVLTGALPWPCPG